MTRSAEAVLADALSLDDAARAEIAAQLIASLDGPAEPDAEAAWRDEVARRVAALDAGELPAEPWEVALQRIESELHRR
jgi:putative addiction module component (TIGR02574 family)